MGVALRICAGVAGSRGVTLSNPPLPALKLSLGVRPFADESLCGWVARACELNVLRPALLFEALGEAASSSTSLATRCRHPERLASALRAETREVAARLYTPNPADGEGVLNFFGATISKSLRTAARRVSPASLRLSLHHRAIWELQPIVFCPDTWTLLTDRCLVPACSAKLHWRSYAGIHRCEACGADQRDFETAPIADHLRGGLAAIAALVDPMANVGSTRATLPTTLAGVGRGDVFHIALVLAEVAGGGHPYGIEMLAKAGSLLAGWPASVSRFLLERTSESEDRDGASRAFRAAVNRASTPIQARSALEGLAAELSLPAGCHPVSRARMRRAAGLLTLRQAARLANISSGDLRRAIDTQVVKVREVGGNVRRHAWMTPMEATSVRLRLKGAMPAAEFGAATGFSLAVIEDLVTQHLIARSTDVVVGALRPQLHLVRASAEAFLGAIARLPAAEAGDRWLPIGDAMRKAGMPPSAMGRAIGSILGGRLRGARAIASDRVPGDLLVEREMADRLAQNLPRPSTNDNLPTWQSQLLTFGEAMRELYLHPRELSVLIVTCSLRRPTAGRRYLCRSSVERIRDEFVSTMEVAARLTISPLAARRSLARSGVPAGPIATLWQRCEFEIAFAERLRCRPYQLQLPLEDFPQRLLLVA